MFFDCILLSTQNQGRFGYAWIAATRGIRYLSEDKIRAIDLMKLW